MEPPPAPPPQSTDGYPSQPPSSSSSIPNPNSNPTNVLSPFPQHPVNRTSFNRPSQFSYFPSQFHSSASPSSAPARPPVHGMQSTGMIGSQMRPGGVPPSVLHQQRPVQVAAGIRPQSTLNNLPSVPQNFQGHGVLRASAVTAPSTSTPNTSQSLQSHQPWLSGPHGRPPLPSQSFRPTMNSQSLQLRSHIPPQSPQLMPATSQPQQLLSTPQQQQHFPAPNQSQENYGQQLSSSRVSQPLANQQQTVRVQGLGNQRPPSLVLGQASAAHPGPTDKTGDAEAAESCSTILSKRNIQELINQIDPSEKLDAEAEDVLVDIAEDFIESVTTFGCSLAKHRKSTILEANDILLHLERAWNMTLPGFSGDEIKTFKKPVANDIHKERLAVTKKSPGGAEMMNIKSSAGPAAGNIKGHLAKATPNAIES